MLRAGIIGLDTSHVTAFTKLLNNPKNEGDLAGVRVVAAFPGGSQDVASSRDRLEGFTKHMRDKFTASRSSNSIEELLAKVDVVLLESVDGRPHLQQAMPVLKAGKPVFIDKPLGGSLADVLTIFDLAKQSKTPVFSSSSLRYYPGIAGAKNNAKIGRHHRLPDLRTVHLGAASSRPVLVRHSRRGSPLHHHGARLQDGVSRHTRTTRKSSPAFGHAGRIGTFRGIRKGKEGYDGLGFRHRRGSP